MHVKTMAKGNLLKLAALFVTSLIIALAMNWGGVPSTALGSPNESHIKSWELTTRKTGTPKFNATAGPGKDTTADDTIVRTFDKCDYTLTTTATYGDSTDDRILYFRFSMNKDAAGRASWYTQDMGWLKEPKVSADKSTITGYYTFDKENASITQGFNAAIQVGGLPDGFQLNPTFEIADNPEFNNALKIEEPLTVTSKLMVNVKVTQGNLAGFYYKDPETQQAYRIFAAGVSVQVYNEDGPGYGMKGVAATEGPVQYTLEALVERRADAGLGVTKANVTDVFRPEIFDYKLNDDTRTGVLGHDVFFKSAAQFSYALPAAFLTDRIPTLQRNSMGCYDSGKVTLVSENHNNANKSTFTFSTDNYQYHPHFKFPTRNFNNIKTYLPKEYEGNFSTHVIYFKVPIKSQDELDEQNRNADFRFYVRAQQDISAQTTDAQDETISVNKQVVSDYGSQKDDVWSASFNIRPDGNYNKASYLADWDNQFIYRAADSGVNSRAAGDKIIYKTRIYNSNTFPENMPRSINALMKFNPEWLTPIAYKNGKHYTAEDNAGKKGTFTYKMLYGAKSDGTNWTDVTEQSRTKEEDLTYYESLEALQADGKTCVALLFESQENDPNVFMSPDTFLQVESYFQISDDTPAGTTIPFCFSWRGWKEPQDRTTQTRLNPHYVENPPTVELENWTQDTDKPLDYKPAEYNENGECIDDHNDYHRGNTLYIIGGNIKVTKELLPHENGIESSSFDLSKGDAVASWKLTPTYTGVDSKAHPITVEEWLPSELTLIPGSTTFDGVSFDDPTFVKSVTITQQMIDDKGDYRWWQEDLGKVYNVYQWNIGSYTADDEIPSLIFKAEIDPATDNTAQLKNNVTVSSPGLNDPKKQKNSAYNAIKIINNPMRGIFKSPFKDVIETFDSDGFKIRYINNSDAPVPYFHILDIMPYNGDSRGSGKQSKIDGSVNVASVVLDGTDVSSLKVYGSEDPSVRSEIASNIKPSEDSRFTEITDPSNINKNLVAIAVAGSAPAQSKVYVSINANYANNKGGNIHVNNATAIAVNKANPTLDEIKAAADTGFITNTTDFKVVERQVTGLLWLDANGNGIQDKDETARFANVTVSLVDKDGKVVTGRDGKPVSAKTDENGVYTLGYAPMGDYTLSINKAELAQSAQKLGMQDLDLTKLNAGEDKTIDSDAVEADDKTAYLIKDISLPNPLEIAKLDNPETEEFEGLFSLKHLDAGLTKLVDITATKTWEGIDKDYPTIYFKLQRQAAGQNAPEDVEGADLKELPDGTTKVVWEGLEKYNPAGKEYTYSVVETDQNGTPTTPTGFFKVEEKLSVINQLDTPPTFEKKVEGEDVYHLLEPEDEFEYSFTSEIPQYVRQFTKFVISDTFDAPFAIQGTPKVEIYKDGALDEELTAAAQSYCSTSGQTAAFTLENNKLVQKFAGTKVVVKVKTKLDFTQDVADYVVAGALPNTAKLQWTNNPKDDLEDSAKLDVSVNIKATKTWEGISKDFPTIYFKLQRATGNNAPEDVPNAEIKELANGDTEALWETLPRFSSDGQKYKYSVVEVDKEGNPATPAGFFKVEEELNVINSPDVPPTLEKKVNELDYYHVLDLDEVFEYTFSSTLPEYVRKFTKFELSDTFVNALAIQGTPTVEVLKDGAVDETLTAEAQSYIKVDGQTVSFILDDNAKVKHFAGATFVVHTNAKLNFDQDVASYVEQGAIPNEVTLKWTDNPKDDLEDHASINVSVDIKATKTWEGITKDFPTIYFKLQRATGDNAPEDVPNAEIKELANGATEATWNTLPRFSSDGKVYKYSVVEVDKDGNPATPAGFFKVEEELNVINSPDVPPTLEKTVNEVKDYQLQDKNETVTYTFSSKLPQYVRKFTKFDLSDTFSDVFMIQSKPQVEVLKGGKVDKDLTAEAQKYVSVSGQTVSFVLDSNEKVVPFAGCEIVVSVDAKLNSQVDYKKYEVEGAIPNTVTLKWTNDPKEDLKDSAKIRYPKHHPDVPEKEKEPKPKTPAYTGRIPKTSDGSGLGLIAGITLSASVLGALGLAGLKRKKA